MPEGEWQGSDSLHGYTNNTHTYSMAKAQKSLWEVRVVERGREGERERGREGEREREREKERERDRERERHDCW